MHRTSLNWYEWVCREQITIGKDQLTLFTSKQALIIRQEHTELYNIKVELSENETFWKSGLMST